MWGTRAYQAQSSNNRPHQISKWITSIKPKPKQSKRILQGQSETYHFAATFFWPVLPQNDEKTHPKMMTKKIMMAGCKVENGAMRDVALFHLCPPTALPNNNGRKKIETFCIVKNNLKTEANNQIRSDKNIES